MCAAMAMPIGSTSLEGDATQGARSRYQVMDPGEAPEMEQQWRLIAFLEGTDKTNEDHMIAASIAMGGIADEAS